MTQQFNPTPDVDCKYGAPMGRPARSGYWLKGDFYPLAVMENAPPFRLVRCPLDSGGCDRGGAYWGTPSNLYYYEGPVSDISGYVRGNTRELAKAAVRSIHPHARFYR